MSGARPDIAVVMPSYNPGPEIGWTLESLRAQTVPFKLFVVDDGSRTKPDYAALLAGFDHELIELPRNVGPCTVRNPAMQRAIDEGFEFIALIDCGDWAYPHRLEAQRDFLKARPEIGVVGSAVEVFKDDMSYAYDFNPPLGPDEIRKGLYYKFVFKHPAMTYRASLLRRIGLYSAEFDAAEDYDLVRRAALVSDLANLPAVLIKVVEYSSGVSATRRTAQLWSRLRIQWRYRDLANPHCWFGLARSLLTIAAPTAWIRRARPLVYGTRGRGQHVSHAARPR